MTKTFTLQNTMTGMTYSVDKETCDRMVIEEPETFKVIDEDYKEPEKEFIDTRSVSEKVIIKEQPLDTLKVAELKNICDVRSIQYKKGATKPELIALIKENIV